MRGMALRVLVLYGRADYLYYNRSIATFTTFFFSILLFFLSKVYYNILKKKLNHPFAKS